MLFIFTFPIISDDDTTNELKTMTFKDLKKPENKFHAFRLTNGYENTQEELIRYKADFSKDVEEINQKPIKNIRSKKYLKLNYKQYYSHSDAVLYFFKYTITQEFFNSFEKVSKDEFYIFERCLNSGLITLNLEYKNKPTQCYGQDFSRFYPNLLQTLKIPNKQGKKVQLDNVEYGNLQYGIYRIKITYTDQTFTNIFNFSKLHHYHSSTINHLYNIREKYGLSFELLKDDDEYDYNAYVYEFDDLVDGKEIFKSWFKMLDKLREQYPKNKLVKHLMSSLWGTLTSFKKLFIRDDETELYDMTYLSDEEDSEYKIIKNQDSQYHIVLSDDAFKHGLARIKPFLTSFSRLYIMKFIHKTDTEKHIVRIHTDGIVYNKPFEFDKMNLKYYPLPEDKTTGLINYHNAVYGFHICLKCKGEFYFKDIKCHQCI